MKRKNEKKGDATCKTSGFDDVVHVRRTDPVYNMHGYLTKVPYLAIEYFIEKYSPPGGLVVDMFAGSGMTAIASKICGRNATVSDISALGRHIGSGYLTEVDAEKLRQTAKELIGKSREALDRPYDTERQIDQQLVELNKTIWSFVYKCNGCSSENSYYHMLEVADWSASKMVCPNCEIPFEKKKSEKVAEIPVLVSMPGLMRKQIEQPLTDVDYTKISDAKHSGALENIPNKEITPDREMYKRSALEKWGLTQTRNFFSHRNARVLNDVWTRINEISDLNLQQKLRFIFTAILPRASKRYQWSKKAPLNAANQNYYIAPVFYEWNVYELFLRKVEAAVKSDGIVFGRRLGSHSSIQEYVTASADSLDHITDESVDYVFTDPPFGSNIFYSDMNLFHEAWLGVETDRSKEAVIRTTGKIQDKERSAQNYSDLLKAAFSSAYRILKPGGYISVVFGNSKGEIWAMAQRALTEAGFAGKPAHVHILDKGQRSVKGLNSGTENVVTLDLIITFQKCVEQPGAVAAELSPEEIIDEVFSELKIEAGMTASHIYLQVLKSAIYHGLPIADIDLAQILERLRMLGYEPDMKSGHLKAIDKGAM